MAGPQPGMQSYAYPAIPPYQAQSTVHQGEQPNHPIVVPDLDDPKVQSGFKKNPPETFEDPSAKEKREFLEERLRAIEGTNIYGTVDALELCLVPNVAIPHKFKVPYFDKYDGTTCPRSHLIMYCRKMAACAHDDKLLIHFFQDSLTGAASR